MIKKNAGHLKLLLFMAALTLGLLPMFSDSARAEGNYLTFTGTGEFQLSISSIPSGGTLEYSTNASNWTAMTASTSVSSAGNFLYLRGKDISTLYNCQFTITPGDSGNTVACSGDIRSLMNYNDPEGWIMTQQDCFSGLFKDCTCLTKAPDLPSTTLTVGCYSNMFYGCTSLTEAPALPATTLANSCYQHMFNGCTSLTEAPALPATTLAYNCYYNMFKNCTSLTTAPALPAETLAPHCYAYMFNGCTSLAAAPALPATTLAQYCYLFMFGGCTSLTEPPALPATSLSGYCYQFMFFECTNIKLSASKTGEYTKAYRIPEIGTGSAPSTALTGMFMRTGGTFTGTPTINTTYYLQAAGYSVTYDANGATGGTAPTDSSSPYISGSTVTVLGNTGSLEKTDYLFDGWNTAADGSGTHYAADDTFTITENTTLYAQWANPEFSGSSMTLSSLLRMQIYVTVPEGFDSTGAYITFDLPGRTQQRVNWAAENRVGSTNKYAFDCVVRAYQLADPITATFNYVVGDTNYSVPTDRYSVAGYLKLIIEDTTNKYSETEKTQARALLTYGYYLQPYLAELNSWTLSDSKYKNLYNVIPSTHIDSLNKDAAQSGSRTQSDANNVDFIDYSVDWAVFLLNLTDGIDLQFRIKLNEGYTVASGYVDNQPGGETLEDGAYSLTKFGIHPNNLEVDYHFELTNNIYGTSFSAQISPMFFIHMMLENSSDAAEQKAMTALYQYWNATKTI